MTSFFSLWMYNFDRDYRKESKKIVSFIELRGMSYIVSQQWSKHNMS